MKQRTLSELAALCGAQLQGDPERTVSGPAPLREARSDQISFCSHPRYRRELDTTQAGALVVPLDLAVPREGIALLRCADPNRAFTAIIRDFAVARPRPAPGVHASAVVHPSAAIAPDASIGPLCAVGEGARVGERSVLYGHVSLGAGAEIGADCELFPMVVIYPDVRIGSRCTIHGGAVLGADGYGFEPTREGWVKIPQCGTVVIEDDVEIGANTTIDRARFGATRIGRGAKIDDQVHVGHNVIVGENTMLVAQVGIAGSTRVGRNVILAGQVGVNGHIEIGDGTRAAGQTGITADVPPKSDLSGTPARPRRESLRTIAYSARVPELERTVRELVKRVAELEAPHRDTAGDLS